MIRKMKIFGKSSLFLFLLLIAPQVWGQFNPYKYVVVPAHFEDYRKSNQYQTSTVIKYLFTQLGIPAVYDNQQPTDLKMQPCLGAYVRLYDTSGMFVTRVRLDLVDCEGKIISETPEGTSKSKDFIQAYKEAIINAFKVYEGITYEYEPMALPVKDNSVLNQAEVMDTEVAVQDIDTPVIENQKNSSNVSLEYDYLYAQPTASGFQLVDSVPSIRMMLIKTSQQDIFLVTVGGVSKGTVFKSEGKWLHEYLEDNMLKREVLQIKF